ncbi:MAG TPA: sigma-70 family RNA polymerase sigma factor [Phycisphaerae bacterium]|nr:sigma-70 family RNA polymerase sigma factor [Phycisphaerae bacterium]
MDTTHPSLLLRLKDHRDAAAWQVFDDIYRPMMERFALVRGLAPADAEDVVQQCMAALADHIRSFEYDPAKGRFKSWLRTMVNNKVRNFVRDRREVAGDSGPFRDLASPEASAEEVFEKLWKQEHLWHCLRRIEAQVDATTFTAFRLFVLEQRPVEEVSAASGLSANNVYTIKWRLTQKVAEMMAELVGDDG